MASAPKAAAEMPASTEKELFLRLPTVPNLQKKAEFTNILFNIMNEKRAKGAINVERELQHFGRSMNNTEGMVT